MPVVVPVMIPLLALLCALAALALAETENVWLRPLLEALSKPRGSFLKRVALKAAALVVTGVIAVERSVRSVLSHFAAAGLHLIGRFFNGMATLVHHSYAELAHLADDVADAVGYLRHHTIPYLIRAAVRPVDRLAHDAYADARRSISLVHRAERDFTRGIDRLRHALEAWVIGRLHGIDRLLREGLIPRLRSAERAIGHVVGQDIPALWRRERALEREVYGDLRARIGRIERALGLGVFAALVYKILAKVAPWLFCRNVNTLGRVVCGLNQDTMNALLAALLGTIALRDLRTLAEYAEAVEREIAEEVKRLVSA